MFHGCIEMRLTSLPLFIMQRHEFLVHSYVDGGLKMLMTAYAE